MYSIDRVTRSFHYPITSFYWVKRIFILKLRTYSWLNSNTAWKNHTWKHECTQNHHAYCHPTNMPNLTWPSLLTRTLHAFPKTFNKYVSFPPLILTTTQLLLRSIHTTTSPQQQWQDSQLWQLSLQPFCSSPKPLPKYSPS